MLCIFFLQCSCTSDLYQQNLDPAVNPDQIQNWSWILCWLHVQPQDLAMWLDGELCGVVGNNNMCWPGPLAPHLRFVSHAMQATNCSFSLGVWTHSRDWDESGPEKSRVAWLVPDHGVSPVIFYLIAIRCRPLSPIPGISWMYLVDACRLLGFGKRMCDFVGCLGCSQPEFLFPVLLEALFFVF